MIVPGTVRRPSEVSMHVSIRNPSSLVLVLLFVSSGFAVESADAGSRSIDAMVRQVYTNC
jgi:hypothetical protein